MYLDQYLTLSFYTVFLINLLNYKFFGSTEEPLAFQTFEQSQQGVACIALLTYGRHAKH